ncbi:MAG: cache domain-containing protein [Arcobacteraceae bacterium]
MSEYKETTLLKNISMIPILIFIFFSMIIIFILIDYHTTQLNQEAKQIQRNYINLNKDIIKKEATKIHDIIQTQYNEAKLNDKFSEDATKERILKLVQSIKYDATGYIFIINSNGQLIVNINKNLLLKTKIKAYDKNEIVLKKTIDQIMQKEEGYISYMGILGTHSTQSEKISYVKKFKPWNWIVGYGFHPSDIQTVIDAKVVALKKEHQSYLQKFVSITIFISVILIVVLTLLSKKIQNIFIIYKQKLEIIEEEHKRKNDIINQQSKIADIGELLNMIAHQWRQPLSQINSLTLNMYMEQKSGSLNEQKLKQAINDIENTTQYLSQTIDDFSKFFVQECNEKNFVVNKAIGHCLNIVNPSLQRIDMQIDFQSKKCVNGYRTLFQQVILSLITNSLDSFNTKTISTPNIDILTYDMDEFICIEISDNAGGIEEQYFSKIFDLYFSTKRKNTPTGMGLYIAKKIVNQHFNGDIFATNLNDGVKFTIRIKAHDTE